MTKSPASPPESGPPLTLGTAGHIDHGKTALVAALTGTDTDRLPEERERGISIQLGYAQLRLSEGRPVSIVDVPGHERFVRTMVAGATGLDAFVMVVAADDGVMPQTIEHARVLESLAVQAGVVAVTKAELADPGRAVEQIGELLPGVPVVPCSARTGEGISELREQLDRVLLPLPGRAEPVGGESAETETETRRSREPVLHVDRVFSAPGLGTVVTGTLWQGTLAVGDELVLEPAARAVRIRGLHVHDHPVERAAAGQRVAANLAGVKAREVDRGDVLTAAGARPERRVLDCALDVDAHAHAEQVLVHHGTREAPARIVDLGGGLAQLRLDRPLLAADGDHVVVRRASPPATLGGGRILDAAARRHGQREDVLARLRALRDGEPVPVVDVSRSAPPPEADAAPDPAVPEPLSAAEQEAADRLREADLDLLPESAFTPDQLRRLRNAGVAVRVSGRLYGSQTAVSTATVEILRLIERDGDTGLREVRDALRISRRSAQALLEHLDARRLTSCDDRHRRTLRHAAVGAGMTPNR